MVYLEARLHGRAVRWPLPRSGRLVVGRDADCDVVIDDESISRRHLALVIQPGAIEIEDLQSTNGLWLGGQRIERIDGAFDRWFVAGRVLMALRRGLSLASGEGFSSRRLANEAAETPELAPLSSPSGERSAGSRSDPALGELIDRITTADDLDRTTSQLLDLLVERHRLRTAALLERQGNGWSLRALVGHPAPAAVDAPLLAHDPATLPVRIETEEGRVLYYPVGPAAASATVLVLHPWDDAAEPGEDVRLTAALCGWWLRATSRGAESRVQPARSSVSAAATSGFIAHSSSSRELLNEVDRLAASPLSVVLCGETGTGKELLARRLHEHSPRHRGPFLALNCSAIPVELIEAELFGIERGVATGVRERAGKFVLASGGTLFLDEIGDLPRELQPKLLRALENGEVQPLGSPGTVPIDVRLVSATHRDLHAMAASGAFRADLLYRLEGAAVMVAPLRERREDILPLARAFAIQAAAAHARDFDGISLEAARALLGHSWPGNARELRNVMTRAVALAEDRVLHAALLPPPLVERSDRRVGDALLGLGEDWRTARERFDRLYFSQLLERHGDNLSEAARIAGLSRSNLYRKLEELGLREGRT